MKDFSGLITAISTHAKTITDVIGAVVPGAAAIPALIKAGRTAIALIDKAKRDFGSDADVLDADRDALDAAILARGEAVEDRLAG